MRRTADSMICSSGSKFLKAWMAYLEEKADLRYPDLADLPMDD